MPDESSSTNRVSVWEWALVGLVGGNIGWTTLCLGGYRPETMVVTTLLNALTVAVYCLGRAVGASAIQRTHPAAWLTVPFLLYAAANVLWVSPVRWRGWLDWLLWAQMAAVFWVVLNGVQSKAGRRALLGMLMALGTVAVVLACYQRFRNPEWLMLGRLQSAQFLGRSSGPFGIPNSLAALLALLLPLLGVLAVRRRASVIQRVFFGYLTAVFVLGLVLTISRGAWLALGLVLAVWPLVGARAGLGRRLRWSAAAGGAVLLLALGLIAVVPAVRERFVALKVESGERTRPIMWRGAWQIFVGHPVLGGGGGSYNVLFEKHRPENYQDEPVWAHNDYLNTLSDYGLVGFLLALAGGAAILGYGLSGRPQSRDGGGDERLIRQALAAGLATFALQLMVDFNLKIPALAMVFATVAAFWVQRAWQVSSSPLTRVWAPRLGHALAGAAAVGMTAWGALPLCRGEALRYAARQSVDRIAAQGLPLSEWGRVLAAAEADLRTATVHFASNGATWGELAYVLALRVHVEPMRMPDLAREAEAAANQALGCTRVVPEIWVRHAVALDMQGKWPEADASFAEALRLGPARAATWYNYAFHLGLNRQMDVPALTAVERCLRLDPANKEAQALRQRLATRVSAH